MPLQSRVSRVLQFPSPILTAYLDVNPGNPRNQSTPRGYLRWLKSAGKTLFKQLPRSSRKAFQTQLGRIEEYVRTARPRSRGLVVFSGPHAWEAIPLQTDVAEELHWGKPSLQHMAWVLDEHRARGAILIGGSGARFFRFWLGEITEGPPIDFSLDISSWRKPHLVGPSTSVVAKQSGVQRDIVADRAAQQRKQFLAQLSRRIVEWSNEGQISPVILAGEAREIEAVLNGVPAEMRDRFVSFPRLLSHASHREIRERLLPVFNRWEREYEAALVNSLLSGRKAHRTIVGLNHTLDQLQKGLVRELVVARGLSGSVQQCTNCGWVEASADAVCPICGSTREPRALRTILPQLASSQAVPIEVVAGAAARKLLAACGIGAWPRTVKAPSRQKTNIPLLSQAG